MDVDSILTSYQSMKEIKAQRVILKYWRRYKERFCKNQFNKKKKNITRQISNLLAASLVNTQDRAINAKFKPKRMNSKNQLSLLSKSVNV